MFDAIKEIKSIDVRLHRLSGIAKEEFVVSLNGFCM